MNWLRTLMRKLLGRPADQPVAYASPELREAQRAAVQMDQRLGEVKDATPEIIALADRLKTEGRENDFATRLWSAFGGASE